MQISDPNFEPGCEIRLQENEVHLWRIDLDQVAAAESRWRGVLSQDERIRADRFKFTKDRQNFTATRALLRTLLGSYLAENPKELTFVYGQNEKPSLGPGHGPEEVQFNVSHSGVRALIAIARKRPVGVDIEEIRENIDCDSLARRYFSPSEQAALAALQVSERSRAFFRCWTRKEAYIKAHGTGLALPLHAFDVSIASTEENVLLATRPNAVEVALWSIRAIEAGQSYEAALCVQGRDWVLNSPCEGGSAEIVRG